MITLANILDMQNKDKWNARYARQDEILYTCPVCSSLVEDKTKHTKWHERNFPKTQEAEKVIRDRNK